MGELSIEQKKALAKARAKAVLMADREQMTHNPPDNGARPVEGLADARDRAVYRENPTASALASAISGVPFVGEYIDEAAGLIGGPNTRDAVRAGIRGYEAEKPTASTLHKAGAGIVAGIPMALAAAPTITAHAPSSIAGQALYGAAVGGGSGAVEGAMSGFGAGEGMEQRLEQAGDRAVVGAGVGSVGGAIVPVAGAGAGALTKGVRGRVDNAVARQMGVSPEAAALVGRMVRNDGAPTVMSNLRAAGDEAMLADAGPATSGLLDTAVQSAGPAGRVAREAIDERVTGASRSIDVALNDAFGNTLIQGRKGKAGSISPTARRKLYDIAYKQPIDYSADAGREIESLLPRIPADAINTANRMMKAEGVESAQIMARISDDGSVVFEVMPDVRQLDYITRGLNDVAAAADGKGKLGGTTNEGRIYAGLAREIRTATKEAVPAYKRALDRAASDISLSEARDLGEIVLMSQTKRGDIAEAVSDMGRAEREKLKQGIRTYIDDTLANTKRTITDPNVDAREGMAALKALSSRASKQKLEMVIGAGPAKGLLAKIERASRAYELRARTAENSRTFARQNMNEAIKDATAPGAIGTLLEGSPVEASRKIAQRLSGMSAEKRRDVQEGIASEIATVLTSLRGADAEKAAHGLVMALERQPVTQALATQVSRLVGSAIGVGLYQSGGRLLQQQ